MLPNKVESLWTGTTPPTNFQELKEKIKTDVVIIGGGIAGINAAYFLKQAGLKIAIIEKTYVAMGTSGNTTAKISSQHHLKYAFLSDFLGKEKAQIYADSNQWALGEFEKIITEEGIDCDYHKLPAYVYSKTEEGVEEIKEEVATAKELNLPASFVDSVESIPFKIEGAIKFENQAYFHPRKYLLSIADKINQNGNYVFEKTEAIDIKEKKDECVVTTDKGSVTAKFVIIATNFPFYDKNKAFAQMRQIRSYVLAVKSESQNLQGMFIGNAENDLSFRPHESEKESWLIIGGVHRFATEEGSANKDYEKLAEQAKEQFNIKSIGYKWSAEDCSTIDRVPYIGRMPGTKNIFVTTGYGAWGMTTSIVSAKLLTDLITGKENEWEKLYTPSRIESKVKDMTEDTIKVEGKEAEELDLEIGEGKVIVKDGKKIAVYKDETGKIISVSAVCTHLGCIVDWNNKDKTWDCPCHGSRFNKLGGVVNGPAVKDLPKA